MSELMEGFDLFDYDQLVHPRLLNEEHESYQFRTPQATYNTVI